jgi:transposase
MTSDIKSYYKITQLLKQYNFPFLSLIPNNKIPQTVNLIITTNSEKHYVNKLNYLTLEEIEYSETFLCLIMNKINHVESDLIIIGIDPGLRIGITVYNGRKKIYWNVLSSINELQKIINEISKVFINVKKIIRIGNGNKKVSNNLARILKLQLDEHSIIEIVDEFGTSSLSKSRPNRRGLRDIKSADIIAFRQGKYYK